MEVRIRILRDSDHSYDAPVEHLIITKYEGDDDLISFRIQNDDREVTVLRTDLQKVLSMITMR